MKKGIFLLSIGDELLDGRTQNTNASWLGEQLRLAGLAVSEMRSVSDRVEDIVSALKAASRYPAVIVTGGLGPTNDDRTLAGAAKAFRRKLGPTKASLAHVRSRYEARGLPLTEARLRMALVPKGGEVLENRNGTAPGVALTVNKNNFYFLPGPPSECRPIFEKDILPRLKKRGRQLVLRRFWRTFGRGESDIYQRVAEEVKKLEKKYPATFAFGVHISFPYIDLTLEVWEGRKKPAKKEVEGLSRHINEQVEEFCFSHERIGLADAVATLLLDKKLTVATAESCTGGMLGKVFTDRPGSSAYYWGGVVSYDNSAKEVLLGVKRSTLERHGAVSAETVVEMADAIRRQLKTDFSLSISGVAGPSGGSAEKPVGLVYVALSSKAGTKTAHQVILNGKGSRDQNRVIATNLALDLLRNALRG
jgi:nicotinamide-nucleotide amidase